MRNFRCNPNGIELKAGQKVIFKTGEVYTVEKDNVYDEKVKVWGPVKLVGYEVAVWTHTGGIEIYE